MNFIRINEGTKELKDVMAPSVYMPTDEKLDLIITTYLSTASQQLYALSDNNNTVGIVGIDKKNHTIEIKHIAVANTYQKKGYGRLMIYNLLHLYQDYNLYAETDSDAVDFYSSVGFQVLTLDALQSKDSQIQRFACSLVNSTSLSGLTGHWESFDIYNYSNDYILQLYSDQLGINHPNVMKELNLLNTLKGKFPTPKILTSMIIGNRLGYILEPINKEIMAIKIRENIDRLEDFASIFAKLHLDIHALDIYDLDLNIDLPTINDIIIRYIDDFEILTDYKEHIMNTARSLPALNSFCHNDFGPYHVFVKNENYYVFDWKNATSGDPLADVAKSIFWLCSEYVPGIGPYLTTSDIKKTFINTYLETYEKVTPIDYGRLTKWLVIFAAIEYDTEVQDEGLTPDLIPLKQFIEDYYAGKDVNFFNYLDPLFHVK